MPDNLFNEMRDEADQQANYDREIEIYASDIDPEMIEIAKRNAEEVGLADIINFSVKDVNTLTIDTNEPVALIGNPPYGERIGDRDEVEKCIVISVNCYINMHVYLRMYLLVILNLST